MYINNIFYLKWSIKFLHRLSLLYTNLYPPSALDFLCFYDVIAVSMNSQSVNWIHRVNFVLYPRAHDSSRVRFFCSLGFTIFAHLVHLSTNAPTEDGGDRWISSCRVLPNTLGQRWGGEQIAVSVFKSPDPLWNFRECKYIHKIHPQYRNTRL